MYEIILLLLATSMAVYPTYCDAKVTNLKLNNTRIFFEKIGESIFFTSKLNVITSINIPETRQLTESLLNCNENMKIICDELIKENPTDLCKPFRRELNWHINQIQKQKNKIKEMYTRQRRGLVDLGGKLAKFILGTMDAEDSEKIYDKLENLQTRQTEIMKIEEQHIAVLKSNFDALSTPMESLQNETLDLEMKLNELVEHTTNFEEITERNQKLTLKVAELSALIIVQCLHISQMQNEATEIITSLENGKLHPLIVPYAKLIRLIEENYENTNELGKSHETLRKVAKVDYTEIDNKLIIKVTIPLLENENFTLYKTHLLPFNYKQNIMTYTTDIEYTAINKLHTKIIELHRNEVNTCQSISNPLEPDVKICQHTQPTLTIPSEHCIANLITNQFEPMRNCEIIHTNPLNTIIRLENENSWLYTINKSTTMIINCRNTTEQINIEGTGVLTFSEPCTMKTREFTAEISGNTKTIEISQPVQKEEETDVTFSREAKNNDRSRIQPLKISDHKTSNVNIIKEARKIQELHNAITQLNRLPQNKNLEYYYGPSAIGVTITLAVVIIIIIVKKNRTNKSKVTVTNDAADRRVRKVETEGTNCTTFRAVRVI